MCNRFKVAIFCYPKWKQSNAAYFLKSNLPTIASWNQHLFLIVAAMLPLGIGFFSDGGLKGQKRKILPLVFILQLFPLGPCLLHYFYSNSVSNSAELFEFEIHPVLWAPAGNQILLQIPGI
jgi:hypothetical protein